MNRENKLYFICDKRRRYVKIGVSYNPENRLFDLQAGCPLELHLDVVVAFDDYTAAQVEDALHQLFARHWLHREWFRYAPQIKAFAKEWQRGERLLIRLPKRSCKSASDEFGNRLTKAQHMARLREAQTA